MRKRAPLAMIFALALGGFYIWKRYQAGKAAQAALAAPTSVSAQVGQSITGS
jgi:hypothetical protein